MYECHNCGRHFDEPDFVAETHGFELPPYERMAVCPYCKGYFEEMYQCRICGQWFIDGEITSGVCDECIYSHDTDVDLCYKLGGEDDALESVKINSFVASVFTPEQINDILLHRIKRIDEIQVVFCTDFIDNDKSWFAEQLIKEKERTNE